MLNAIIFDIGNVLLNFDFSLAVERIRKSSVRLDDATWAEVERLKMLLEEGGISRREFVGAAADAVGFGGSHSDFETAWQEIFTLNEPMAEFVQSLLGHYPLYLLSNTNGIHVEYFVREYPVFGLFDAAIYSHDVRVMKPAPEIFLKAIQTFGVDPKHTAYIDDLLPNIESAREAGFQVLHYDFKQHDLFLKDFAKLAS
ncbi:MAG TPA: HAD family phosphatase [Chthoniobacterales bacterium]